jgi:hypothetical protein
MSDFKPALPKVIRWSCGENRYDEDGKNPKALSLFVPLESAQAFAQYINAQATDPERIKKGKIWDYALQAEVEVEGIYISAKGKDGQYGAFGNINPAAPKSATLGF